MTHCLKETGCLLCNDSFLWLNYGTPTCINWISIIFFLPTKRYIRLRASIFYNNFVCVIVYIFYYIIRTFQVQECYEVDIKLANNVYNILLSNHKTTSKLLKIHLNLPQLSLLLHILKVCLMWGPVYSST